MDNSSRIEVESGSYYTYDSQGSSAIQSGKIYGTNTDPTTFDATDEANWDYVCDLTIISETPVAPPEPVARIEPTGGSWQGDYDYHFLSTNNGQYIYELVHKGSTNSDSGWEVFDVKYDPSDGKWYDIGSNHPEQWGIDDTGTNLSDFPTDPNMPIQYWYSSGGSLRFQFDNPYYVAPPAPTYSYATIVGSGNNSYAIVDFKWTINGGVMEHPPSAAKINLDGARTDSETKPSGLLISSDEDWPDGYQWYDTDVRTYNTLLTFLLMELIL